MAYDWAWGTGVRIPYFANPDVLYQGARTGQVNGYNATGDTQSDSRYVSEGLSGRWAGSTGRIRIWGPQRAVSDGCGGRPGGPFDENGVRGGVAALSAVWCGGTAGNLLDGAAITPIRL